MGNASSTDSVWSRSYNEIKLKHDAAYHAIYEAIKLEEQEKPAEALQKYKEGIQHIDGALSVQVTCPENPELTWEKACTMIQKMKKTRAEVLMRINTIQSSAGFTPETVPEHPPSYEEAISSSSSVTGDAPLTYVDLATALQQLQVDPNLNMNSTILCSYDNVRLYFISPSGQVISTSEPQTLKVSLIQDEGVDAPRVILQVGDWVYPLVPGVSPCYRTDYGAFILPNVHSDEPGSSVGIILPTEHDEEFYDLMENVLHGVVSQTSEKDYKKGKREIAFVEEDISTKVANKIVSGAMFLSQGIITGAEKASNLIDQNTPKLMSKMRPTDQPATIPRPLSRTMQIAENTTGKAAELTGYVAGKVASATMRLGSFLAPHIEKQGTRLLSTGFNMSEVEASAKVKGVLTIAAGAVEAFATVYSGLETSANILGHNLKNNTVKIVQHKYGAQAGDFTVETLDTVGHLYQVNKNTNILRPKTLIKHTAKETGRAFAADYIASTSSQNGGTSSSSSLQSPQEKKSLLEKKPLDEESPK